jgi:NTP pyrophosphatase (non-canonical NTP hydrolase)
LKLNEYQEAALRTSPPSATTNEDLLYGALAACEEAGEYGGLIKKHVRHGHPLDIDKAIKELGDLLWYLAYNAHRLGVTLEYVGALNIEKLRKRYPNGFSTTDSINRKDEAS